MPVNNDGRELKVEKVFANADFHVLRILSSYTSAYTEGDFNKNPSISFPLNSYYRYGIGNLDYTVDSYNILFEQPEVEFVITKLGNERRDETITVQLVNPSSDLYNEVMMKTKSVWVSPRSPELQQLLTWDYLDLGRTMNDASFWLDVVSLALTEKLKDDGGTKYFHYQRIEQARKYIMDSLDEAALDVNRLAAEASLSPFHFIRLFKKVTGMTPRQYILINRISWARQMLRKGASVTDAAFGVGFNSIEHFCYSFRKFTGSVPGSYKKAQFF